MSEKKFETFKGRRVTIAADDPFLKIFQDN